jgi:hypothetical protein
VVGPETAFVGAYGSVGAGAGVVASVAGLVAVSAVEGEGAAEVDAESDFESLEARTAHVTESARMANVTMVSEGRKNLFSIVG